MGRQILDQMVADGKSAQYKTGNNLWICTVTNSNCT